MVTINYHKLISNNTKKRFVKFIKPVILIVSLLTFLYLVINTVNSNALVVKKAPNSHDFSNDFNILDDTVRSYELDKYNDQFLKIIVKELDMEPTIYVNGECPKTNVQYHNIITSLPGDRLIDFIWEYISLWSLSSELKKLKQNSNIYLTDKTINELSTIFDIDCFKFPPLNDVPRKCLNLPLVKVLKSTDTLNLNDYVEEVPFLLEKKSKRIFDIVATDLKPLRQELQIQMDINDEVENFLNNVTNSISIKKTREDSYKHICSYIEDNQQNYLPYLKSSIDFHNREGTPNIFIFMVPTTDYQLYSDEFETSKFETIKVFNHSKSEPFSVGLLLQCHRTIILNEFTLATALINAGIATIPKDDPLFILFKAKIYNWYALSNGDDDSE